MVADSTMAEDDKRVVDDMMVENMMVENKTVEGDKKFEDTKAEDGMMAGCMKDTTADKNRMAVGNKMAMRGNLACRKVCKTAVGKWVGTTAGDRMVEDKKEDDTSMTAGGKSVANRMAGDK